VRSPRPEAANGVNRPRVHRNPALSRRPALTKVIAIIVLGAASLGTVAQPGGVAVAAGFAPANSNPLDKLVAVDDAFTAHGIQWCDGPLVVKGDTDSPPPPLEHGERAERTARFAMVTGPCPPRMFPDMPNPNVDGQIDVVVYKGAAEAKRSGKKDWGGDLQVGYLWNDVLVVLEANAKPELEHAFRATMRDLKARVMFDGLKPEPAGWTKADEKKFVDGWKNEIVSRRRAGEPARPTDRLSPQCVLAQTERVFPSYKAWELGVTDAQKVGEFQLLLVANCPSR
jgi:hypothetical protein